MCRVCGVCGVWGVHGTHGDTRTNTAPPLLLPLLLPFLLPLLLPPLLPQVPIRSLDDHAVLPGIRAGDCGAKFGRNGLDNGYLQFDHVKVPRTAMLCKYAKVDEAGNYTQRGRKQLQ